MRRKKKKQEGGYEKNEDEKRCGECMRSLDGMGWDEMEVWE